MHLQLCFFFLDSNPSEVDKRRRTSAALLPVLGPSLSNTLGRREGAAGLLVLLVVVLLLLLSDMVLEFSTVTFRLILDILQDWPGDKTCKGWRSYIATAASKRADFHICTSVHTLSEEWSKLKESRMDLTHF